MRLRQPRRQVEARRGAAHLLRVDVPLDEIPDLVLLVAAREVRHRQQADRRPLGRAPQLGHLHEPRGASREPVHQPVVFVVGQGDRLLEHGRVVDRGGGNNRSKHPDSPRRNSMSVV